MKIQHFLAVIVSCLLISCADKTVDFSYSPIQPKAGEAVKFTNSSNTGEEWNWSFGDNTSSASKNPVKTYRQPGTYVVTLKVDNKNNLTRTKEITIYDTIPDFTCSIADSIGFGIYEEVTFSSLIYNPFSYEISGKWTITPDTYHLLSDTSKLVTTPLRVYFEKPGSYTVRMAVRFDELDTVITHTYDVKDRPAEALLLRSTKDYRQRIYGARQDYAYETTLDACQQLLNTAQDSMVVYAGDSIFISDAPVISGIEWNGLAIANRRLYLRSETAGLYVINLDGSYPICISENPVFAILTDISDNRIYWAENDSVMFLPLIDSPNNKYTKTPTTINHLQGVVRLAKDNTLR